MEQSVNMSGTKNPHAEKPEKFKGGDFKRWQQKMLFYLTTLNLAHVVKEEAPQPKEFPVDKDTMNAIDAWNHSEFLCRNYILNGLDDTLYDVYVSCKTAKDLWLSLEKKYKTEDAGSKKFVVGKFLDFKMTDSKPVVKQVEDLQIIIHDIHSEGMNISDNFQVAAVIEKLPHGWKDFKSYLKHKRKEMTMEELVVRLRIEEDNRKSEKIGGTSSVEVKAHVIEAHTSKKKFSHPKKKNTGGITKNGIFLGPKGKSFKKQRIKESMYITM